METAATAAATATPTARRLRRRIVSLLGLAAATTLGIGSLAAAAPRDQPGEAADDAGPPTIVLVHGAWGDGSSWSQVTERLQDAGYDVRVPPNNLRSVASDAADLAGFVDTIPGGVVLVGHSYGGMVITNAATDTPNVRALVYVNVLIPDVGDTLVGMTHPPSMFAQDPANVLDFAPYSGAPDGVVDTYVKAALYGEAFGDDRISPHDIAVLAATQRPLSTQVFEEPSGPPAWTMLPSWAVVGAGDRIIPVADQTAMAERVGSEIVRLDTPHLSMLVDADGVTDVIVAAATSR